MVEWIETLLACRRRNEAAVLVTVASTRGSAPRAAGTRMIVTAGRQDGTIGGGHLEWQAVGIARELLAGDDVGTLRRFPLGASLGQCCGGLVNLMFEAVLPAASQSPWLDEVASHLAADRPCALVSGAGRPAASGSMVVTAEAASGTLGDAPSDAGASAIAREMLASAATTRLLALVPDGPLFLFDALRPPPVEIILFGAGHVGRSLVRILAGLPCRVTWVDERAESFPAVSESNVRIEVSDTPVAEVAAARAGSFFLVMTHSHPLDQELTEAILRRGDFSYFGLIGSLTKRRQFERRLAARGVSHAMLRRMTCPIGISGIEGKEPTAIAVAVAAQLLRAMSAQARAAQPEPAHSVARR